MGRPPAPLCRGDSGPRVSRHGLACRRPRRAVRLIRRSLVPAARRSATTSGRGGIPEACDAQLREQACRLVADHGESVRHGLSLAEPLRRSTFGVAQELTEVLGKVSECDTLVGSYGAVVPLVDRTIRRVVRSRDSGRGRCGPPSSFSQISTSSFAENFHRVRLLHVRDTVSLL
jgi:hypothetical protein